MTKEEEEKLYAEIRDDISTYSKALLIGGYERAPARTLCEEHLDELESLATTYGFETVHKAACSMRGIDPKTYFGKGKLQELSEKAQEVGADVIIIDALISPNQERNLEKIFKRPVIDRTGLIIEVFAQRAQTKEAKLQIELAKTQYQLPRLKRLWTHLSRQSTGGGGFVKGEGERQIELDRRMVRKRITKLKKDIEEVGNHREQQRKVRMRTGIPTFAFIGYTNVGKSTLLNALTNAGVFVEDKLFATLDTTIRKYTLPNHQHILLVDTVGFIRKIPHTLVAAFKSTLEEAVFTDILIHLIDVNHPLADEHAEATYEVLKELGVEDSPIITVLNKIDALPDKSLINKYRFKYPRVVAISALTGEGMDDLLDAMMDAIKLLRKRLSLRIPQSEYALVAEIMEWGLVKASDYEENDILLDVEVPAEMEHKVQDYIVEEK